MEKQRLKLNDRGKARRSAKKSPSSGLVDSLMKGLSFGFGVMGGAMLAKQEISSNELFEEIRSDRILSNEFVD